MAGERVAQALKEFRRRYQGASQKERTQVLNEFCRVTKYHRKYAIVLLNRPLDAPAPEGPGRRGVTYSEASIRVLEKIWEAADYPWSVRLKALLPQWLPYARKHISNVTEAVEGELLKMSARQMDRRLQTRKRTRKRRLYGRTKPGLLLKHHIPIKTDHWDVTEAGYTEIDLVSHSGPSASGEFIYSLNVTDIHTCWSETRAVMGRGEQGVARALDEIRQSLPFELLGIDSDNGGEFINYHLYGYSNSHNIQFTRGRPYKKDDNAHIEQKNWTHVRRIFGWDRYDTPEALAAMNQLYRNELRTMMNLFQPCVKLAAKERVGTRLTRRYDAAQMPLDRVVQGCGTPLGQAVEQLLALRSQTDPFSLSQAVGVHLADIYAKRVTPKAI